MMSDSGLPYATEVEAVDLSYYDVGQNPADYAYNPIDPTQGAIMGSGGPPGLLYLVDANQGSFVPANAQLVEGPIPGQLQYDPWTWAQPAKIRDHSMPAEDEYGGPVQSRWGTIVAEWGGMSSPTRDYQDKDYSVVYTTRPQMEMVGGNGVFYGNQQTVNEANYVTPAIDYQSTIYLGGGTA